MRHLQRQIAARQSATFSRLDAVTRMRATLVCAPIPKGIRVFSILPRYAVR